MTQEDKDLLLKDLCARLPYKTAVSVCGIPFHWDYKNFIDSPRLFKSYLNDILRGDVKPYLLPLSSMTEEQKEEYVSLQQRVIYNSQGLVNLDVMEYTAWCYKHHIDINGLIPMGLANDATGLNIY